MKAKRDVAILTSRQNCNIQYYMKYNALRVPGEIENLKSLIAPRKLFYLMISIRKRLKIKKPGWATGDPMS